MRSLLLLNPNSTSVSPRVERLVAAAFKPVTDLVVMHTAHPRHAQELCAGLRRTDVDTIIVLGGDGTVGEVLNGLLGTDPDQRPAAEELPRLAIIPTGSANVYARALGLSNSPAKAAHELARLLVSDSYRRLPLGWVHNLCVDPSDAGDARQRWFSVNIGIGIDADVIHSMERIRKRGVSATPGRYALIAARAWKKLRAQPPRISFRAETPAGIREETDLPLVVVSNTNPWTFAGPVPVVTNPHARTEGALSLFALRDNTGPGGLAAMMNTVGSASRLWSALPLDTREIRVDEITSLTLTLPEPVKWQLDGEFMGKTDHVNIRSIPDVVDMITPSEPTGV